MTSEVLQASASNDVATPRADRVRFGAVAILLACAITLGGTSAEDPFRTMLIELLAIVTLAVVLILWRGPRPTVVQIIGIMLALGIPLLQLVPLAPSTWMALPGREVAADIGRFVDPGMWRPLTFDSNATFKLWLSLFVPVTMFLAVSQMDARHRVGLVMLVVAVALASLLLGLAQILSGGALYLYTTTHTGLALGVFSNRNHQAALLYVAIALIFVLAALPQYRTRAARLVLFGLAAAFLAGIFATESRSGAVLAVLTLLVGSLFVIPLRLSLRTLAMGAAGTLITVFLLSRSGVVRNAMARFAQQATDGRYDFWPDVIYATQAYFPAGAGLGTFVKSYQATEQLTAVTVYFVNHAHNEYLELVLEAGILGALSIAFFLVVFGIRAWNVAFREREGTENTIARGALLAILCLLLHSLVDYPLRTFAHLTLFGMLIAMLYPFDRSSLTARDRRERGARGRNRGSAVASSGRSSGRRRRHSRQYDAHNDTGVVKLFGAKS